AWARSREYPADTRPEPDSEGNGRFSVIADPRPHGEDVEILGLHLKKQPMVDLLHDLRREERPAVGADGSLVGGAVEALGALVLELHQVVEVVGIASLEEIRFGNTKSIQILLR